MKTLNKAVAYFFFFQLAFFSPVAFSSPNSPDQIWTLTEETETEVNTAQRPAKPTNAKSDSLKKIPFNANLTALEQALSNSPSHANKIAGIQGNPIYLPMPGGNFERFEVFENPVMQNDLQKKFPQIKTYKIYGIDSREAHGVVDYGPRGFHAMVSTQGKTFFIDPDLEQFRQNKNTPTNYFLYEGRPSANFQCQLIEEHLPEDSSRLFKDDLYQEKQNGSKIKHYRLAVTTTGEYSEAVSSGAANAVETQAAIVSAIARVNQVFNKDLAIQLELIDNSDLIFLDPDTDPFENDANLDIGNITGEINNAIGSSNYDIGHLLTVNGGGLAFLGSACSNKRKGEGVTGISAGLLESDFFYIDYVAHELGHQIGANHSFNSESGSCKSSRNASTAWEPGSGSTIMAYAGLCGKQNLQIQSDPYFHSGSIQEIINFTKEKGNCYTKSSSGDNPPQINAGEDYYIPANTPFILKAKANDIDGGSILYNWEQLDTGASSKTLEQMNTDNGNRPLFRSLPPATDSERVFPAFGDIVDGTLSKGETFPTTSRTLKFRATARSNDYGIDYDNVTLQVVDTGKTFSIISPERGTYQLENHKILVTWETAKTDLDPVSCPNVDILYSNNNSKDLGDYLLLTKKTPNDGKQKISLPAGLSSKARLLIRCSDNIFFNVSPGTFRVVDDSNSLIVMNANTVEIEEGNELSKTTNIYINRIGNLDQTCTAEYLVKGSGRNPANKNDFSSNQSFSGKIRFPEGETEKKIKIILSPDKAFEKNETFMIKLKNPENCLLSSKSLEITIKNDDPNPNDSKGRSSGGSLNFFAVLLIAGITIMRHLQLKQLYVILLLSFPLFSCSGVFEQKKQINSHTEALKYFENADAEEDLKSALANKKAMFYAIDNKGKLELPGLTDSEKRTAKSHGYLIQEGMGDIIVNEEHLKLRKAFYIYASEFNRLLFEHLEREN